jgi:sarcosine oxidase gamma subunit
VVNWRRWAAVWAAVFLAAAVLHEPDHVCVAWETTAAEACVERMRVGPTRAQVGASAATAAVLVLGPLHWAVRRASGLLPDVRRSSP